MEQDIEKIVHKLNQALFDTKENLESVKKAKQTFKNVMNVLELSQIDFTNNKYWDIRERICADISKEYQIMIEENIPAFKAVVAPFDNTIYGELEDIQDLIKVKTLIEEGRSNIQEIVRIFEEMADELIRAPLTPEQFKCYKKYVQERYINNKIPHNPIQWRIESE